jgi:transcriptional regulator with XRE-family HTH domain
VSEGRYVPRPIVQVDEDQLDPWPRADALRTSSQSPLAWWRLRRGMTQEELAEAAGVPVASYRRMERGEVTAVNLAHLSNCAWVLGVDHTDLIDPDWLAWRAPDAGPDEPPAPGSRWRRSPQALADRPPRWAPDQSAE